MSALADLSAVINRTDRRKLWRPDHPSFLVRFAHPGGCRRRHGQRSIDKLMALQQRQRANGAIPSSVAACDKSLLGAMPFTNPAGGGKNGCSPRKGLGSARHPRLLYDRLLHIGGLNATTTTAQTVGGSLCAIRAGHGNQIWVEIYTQIGSTATTITGYTNQAGTSGRTTLAADVWRDRFAGGIESHPSRATRWRYRRAI